MKNQYLRHILATINYRLRKALTFSDKKFENFSLGKGSRNPIEILIHMIDLLNWTIRKCNGSIQTKLFPEPTNCDFALKIFLEKMDLLDNFLSENELDPNFTKMLLQGPMADLLTHIGQISMLSRMNDYPIEMEDFSKASIKIEDTKTE